MTLLATALRVELRKAVSSRMLATTTVLMVAGIALLAGTLVGAARAGNAQVLAQLGPLADQTGWSLLTGVSAQITAAGALLAFGAAVSWIFGREFIDGTVTGLFAIPVTRSGIALAKLCVHLLWIVAIALVLTVLTLTAGVLLGLGPLDRDVFDQLLRQCLLTFLTGLLAVPAGWAATLGRGPLPGIATTLVILVVAQVTAIAAPSIAPWLPFSAPALWALGPGAVHAGQLVLVALVPLSFGSLTTLAWARLQLDR